MADGLAIFGAVVTSVNIIYGLVDSWKSYSNEVGDVATSLKYYVGNLKRVQDYFYTVTSPGGQLPEDARIELNAMNDYLAGVAVRCLKLQTKLSSSSYLTLCRKLTWKLQQQEVERLVSLLKDWAQEFDIHWVALPSTVRFRYDLSNEAQVRSVQSPAEYIRGRIQCILRGQHPGKKSVIIGASAFDLTSAG